MKPFPLASINQLIEPGPVVLLTTSHNGRANVMTMSWHMMVEFEPPLIACVVSDRNFSFYALRKHGECVIAIPDVKLASNVIAIGNSSGRNIDKFATYGLTQQAAKAIAPPLIRDCFANLECKVVDTRFVNKYSIFILQVVKAWIAPTRRRPKTIHHHGYGTFAVDGKIVRFKSKKR